MIKPRSTGLRHVSSDLGRVGVLLLALAAAAAKPDKADPGCVVQDPGQRAKVGSRCEVHHGQRLRLDIVPIHYGFVTFVPGRSSEDERKRFPNACPWVGGGCVAGPQKFTEVAYCPECRLAYQWDNLRQGVVRSLTWRHGR